MATEDERGVALATDEPGTDFQAGHALTAKGLRAEFSSVLSYALDSTRPLWQGAGVLDGANAVTITGGELVVRPCTFVLESGLVGRIEGSLPAMKAGEWTHVYLVVTGPPPQVSDARGTRDYRFRAHLSVEKPQNAHYLTIRIKDDKAYPDTILPKKTGGAWLDQIENLEKRLGELTEKITSAFKDSESGKVLFPEPVLSWLVMLDSRVQRCSALFARQSTSLLDLQSEIRQLDSWCRRSLGVLAQGLTHRHPEISAHISELGGAFAKDLGNQGDQAADISMFPDATGRLKGLCTKFDAQKLSEWISVNDKILSRFFEATAKWHESRDGLPDGSWVFAIPAESFRDDFLDRMFAIDGLTTDAGVQASVRSWVSTAPPQAASQSDFSGVHRIANLLVLEDPRALVGKAGLAKNQRLVLIDAPGQHDDNPRLFMARSSK